MRELIINGVSIIVGEQVKNLENNNVWNIIKNNELNNNVTKK